MSSREEWRREGRRGGADIIHLLEVCEGLLPHSPCSSLNSQVDDAIKAESTLSEEELTEQLQQLLHVKSILNKKREAGIEQIEQRNRRDERGVQEESSSVFLVM